MLARAAAGGSVGAGVGVGVGGGRPLKQSGESIDERGPRSAQPRRVWLARALAVERVVRLEGRPFVDRRRPPGLIARVACSSIVSVWAASGASVAWSRNASAA